MSKQGLPLKFQKTLKDLEGTISDWEKITPSSEAFDSPTKKTENQMQEKAKVILEQIKSQIEELS